MPARDRLIYEINEILDDLRDRKQPWRQKWIAVQVCNNHNPAIAEAADEDHDFWWYCGYETSMDVIGEVIKKRTDPKRGKEDKQLILPGFKHLQYYYRTEKQTKDGEVELVALYIDDMNDDAILAKIAQYRAQAQAMLEHADELERYLENRRKQRRA